MWSRPSRQPRVTPSGFLNPSALSASPSSRALFHAPTVPELPLQSLPLAKIVYPSQGHWLPCGYPPCVQKRVASSLITPDVPDSRAFGRSRLVPTETMGPLFTRPKPRFPVALDHQRRDHSLPPASSASKRSSLHESVRTNPSCLGLAAATLLAFCSSEDNTLSSLRASYPPDPWGPDTSLRPGTRRRGAGDRLPPNTGRNLTKDPKIHDSASSAVPAPVWNGPHRLSAATRSLLTFQPSVTTGPWPSELLSARDVGSSPKRSAGLL
mgnify:FL=1